MQQIWHFVNSINLSQVSGRIYFAHTGVNMCFSISLMSEAGQEVVYINRELGLWWGA